MSYNALDVLEKIRKKVCIHCFKVQDQCSCGHFETELEDDGLSNVKKKTEIKNRIREQRIKNNECVKCGVNLPEKCTHTLCDNCIQNKKNMYNNRQKNKEEENSRNNKCKKEGKCPRCGKILLQDSPYVYCPICRESRRKASKKHRIKKKLANVQA